MADRILTPSELADALTVSVRTVDSLVADGLPCIELGNGLRRFLWSDSIAWLRSRVAPPPRPAGYLDGDSVAVARITLRRGPR